MHRVGYGDKISLVARVIIVFHPVLDGAGRDRRKKRFFVFLALQSGFEIFDLGFKRVMANIF